MRRPRTLRSRIVFFFCGYLVILLLIYSGAVIIFYRFAEDLVFKRQLSEISEEIKGYVKEHNKLPDSLPMHISVYENIADIPRMLKKYVNNRKDGIYEIVGYDYNYHVAIVKSEPGDHTYYIFYNTRTMQSSREHEYIMSVSLLILAALVLFLGGFMAKYVSSRILNPLKKFADDALLIPLDDPEARLHHDSTGDEMGMIGDTINRLLERISEFIIRKREFISHASHEFRTPVTVIKGAVEIIKSRIDEKETRISKPLSRIERAVSEMEKLVETFFFLAQSEQKPDKNENCDLSAVVKEIVDSCSQLLENKPVKAEVDIPDTTPVKVPASLAAIAIGNIVRNAFAYTDKGTVTVSVLNSSVIVQDTGPGFDLSLKRRGVGLTVVKRLCERLEWKFNIMSQPGEGTCVELVFN